MANAITPGTVEELQNEVQVLHNRIDEEAKKTIELFREKDELEKVSKHHKRKLVIIDFNRIKLMWNSLSRL